MASTRAGDAVRVEVVLGRRVPVAAGDAADRAELGSARTSTHRAGTDAGLHDLHPSKRRLSSPLDENGYQLQT